MNLNIIWFIYTAVLTWAPISCGANMIFCYTSIPATAIFCSHTIRFGSRS